jgi:hypothetical protein
LRWVWFPEEEVEFGSAGAFEGLMSFLGKLVSYRLCVRDVPFEVAALVDVRGPSRLHRVVAGARRMLSSPRSPAIPNSFGKMLSPRIAVM